MLGYGLRSAALGRARLRSATLGYTRLRSARTAALFVTPLRSASSAAYARLRSPRTATYIHSASSALRSAAG